MTSEVPPRAARVSREIIASALHGGMARAIREFEDWTEGESLADWGVEPVLTSACARALRAASRSAGGRLSVTLEQTFESLLDWSGRRSPAGRPTLTAQRVMQAPGRKVDLVIWNGNHTPRAVVEIKRADGLAGLRADAVRIMDFVDVAGAAYGGTIRRGFLAFVVQHPSDRSEEVRLKRTEHRLVGLTEVGRLRNFTVTHSVREVRAPDLRDYCCVQTVVLEFSRPRPAA